MDLGTTYSSAAVLRADRVEICVLGHRHPLVPSAVWLGPDGQRLFGDAAIRRGLRQPQRLAREFKRRLGDSVPLIIGGAPVSADQLTSMLLAWIVDQVAAAEGELPQRIGVTHPANWGPYRREVLAEAVRAAGFADAVLITEPEAAALYYASTGRVGVGEIVVVYDLGGGTFDVAVLERQRDRFVMLGAPDGVERLGGIDFDAAVIAYVRQWVAELDRPAADSDEWRAAVRRLQEECVEAKEALSSDATVDISVMLPARHVAIRLVRSEFENMIRPALGLTLDAVRRALNSAGVTPDDIDRVLLVGGSSRIPLVGELVGSELHKGVSVDVHPKFAVALGAAMAAGSGGAIDESVRITGLVTADPASGRLAPLSEPLSEPVAAALTTVVAEWPPPAQSPAPPGPSVPRATRARRPRVALAVGAAALVAAALIVVAVATRSGDGSSAEATDARTTAVTSGASTTEAPTTAPPVTTTIPPSTTVAPTPHVVDLGGTPGGLSVGFGSAWVATSEGQLIEVDPVSGEVLSRVELGDQLDDVVVGADALWVTGLTSVHRVDPAAPAVVATVELPGRADALAATPEGIWVGVGVTGTGAGELYRIDEAGTTTPTLVASLPAAISEIAVDDDTIWLTSGLPVVHRIDRATNERLDIDVAAPPQGMAVAFDAVWITVSSTNQLLRLDPRTGQVVAEIVTGAAPNELAVGDGVVWFTEEGAATVAALNPRTNEIVRRLDVGTGPDRVVWADPRLLVANTPARSLSILVP